MEISNTEWTLSSVFRNVFVLILVGIFAASCNDVNLNGPSNGKAHMNVHLTDAPADYQQVNVDVQGLRIHYTPNSSDTTDGEGKWIDLPVESMKINLLDLTNGVDTLLSSADLDPGHYRELRLMLGSDNTVMVDSMMHDLKVPSGQQSGYKIKFDTDLESGDEIDLVVDFDAARSVHEAGNSGKYILRPVLKAFVESGAEVETGSIIGAVEPCTSDARIFALMEQDTAASTQPDTTGAFTLAGLDEGMYDVSINPCSDSYADTTVTDVTVNAGEETDIGTITLSETQ